MYLSMIEYGLLTGFALHTLVSLLGYALYFSYKLIEKGG